MKKWIKKWKRFNWEDWEAYFFLILIILGTIYAFHPLIQKDKDIHTIKLVNEIGQIIKDNNSKVGNKKIISEKDFISFLETTKKKNKSICNIIFDTPKYYFSGIKNGSFCIGFQPEVMNIKIKGVLVNMLESISDNMTEHNIFENGIFEYCYLKKKEDLEKVDIRNILRK